MNQYDYQHFQFEYQQILEYIKPYITLQTQKGNKELPKQNYENAIELILTSILESFAHFKSNNRRIEDYWSFQVSIKSSNPQKCILAHFNEWISLCEKSKELQIAIIVSKSPEMISFYLQFRKRISPYLEQSVRGFTKLLDNFIITLDISLATLKLLFNNSPQLNQQFTEFLLGKPDQSILVDKIPCIYLLEFALLNANFQLTTWRIHKNNQEDVQQDNNARQLLNQLISLINSTPQAITSLQGKQEYKDIMNQANQLKNNDKLDITHDLQETRINHPHPTINQIFNKQNQQLQKSQIITQERKYQNNQV